MRIQENVILQVLSVAFLYNCRYFWGNIGCIVLILPATFIATLAGLALLGTIGSSLANALTNQLGVKQHSLLLATAANVTLLGVGGAFWGLVAGLGAHLLMNVPLLRKQQSINEGQQIRQR